MTCTIILLLQMYCKAPSRSAGHEILVFSGCIENTTVLHISVCRCLSGVRSRLIAACTHRSWTSRVTSRRSVPLFHITLQTCFTAEMFAEYVVAPTPLSEKIGPRQHCSGGRRPSWQGLTGGVDYKENKRSVTMADSQRRIPCLLIRRVRACRKEESPHK